MKEKISYITISGEGGYLSFSTERTFLQEIALKKATCPSLEKNEFELLIINNLIEVYDEMFKELNLDIKFNKNIHENIIVLSKESFEKEFGPSGPGVWRLGNIYLIRNDNNDRFISTTAHEMTHLFSYFKSIAKVKENPEQILLSHLLTRTGIQIDATKNVGVNEAITDMLAYVALSKLSQKLKLNIEHYMAYMDFVEIIERIIEISSLDFTETKKNLYRSYFLGENLFLDEIIDKIKIEGLKDDLMIMDRDNKKGEEILAKLKAI